jgi:hypothetical protein
MRFTYFLAVVAALALTACSGDKKNPDEGMAKALQVCKYAGGQACGIDADGTFDAVLECQVTQEYGRVWMVVEYCPAGCMDLACLPLPEDVHYDLPQLDLVAEVADLPPPCVPDCAGKECGEDGCGGTCGLCPTDHKCTEEFTCILFCEPKCTGKQCGDDGCGGSCGDCPFQMACFEGSCQCNPQCNGKDCGPDGCGGSCGTCLQDFICSPFGTCDEICKPACEGKLCGDDGCGGVCGTCPPGLFCSPEGECTDTCYPDCVGKQCGPDGCGGFCGFCPCPTCGAGQVECNAKGKCVESTAGIGCNDLILCLNDCISGDTGCQTACFNSATPQAQTMYEDLIDCIVVQCGSSPSDACVQEVLGGFCAGQFLACTTD